MAKRKKRKMQKKGWKDVFIYEVIGLVMFALICIGLANYGIVGEVLIQSLRFFTGDWYLIVFIYLLILAIYYIIKHKQPVFFTRRLVGFYLLYFSILLLSHVKLFTDLSSANEWQNTSVIMNTWELYRGQLTGVISSDRLGGGMLGALGFAFFYILFDAPGTMFISFFFIVISLILITGRSLKETFGSMFGSFFKKLSQSIEQQRVKFAANKQLKKERKERHKEERQAKIEAKKEELDQMESIQDQPPIIHDFSETEALAKEPIKEETTQPPVVSNKQEEEQSGPEFAMTTPEDADYKLPSLNLLNHPKKNTQQNEKKYVTNNIQKLERTFHSFGVRAKVKKVHLGPAVTRYEVYPDVGVKVSKIVSLTDDLALALAAKEIRIEAPIPGKSAVGIEVPNQEITMVSLREVLESDQAKKQTSKLAIGLGRDISGEPILAELNRMPHLLVAGATGSGKSVCINSIITSLLMRTKPHEVKLLMIDPKMVELNVYNGVPHLMSPVVTNPKKASQALKKVVGEMERRYELFSHSGTRNLESYNQHVKRYNEENDEDQPLMPYIVVIIDELADLMMVASKDVEEAITRLAQMARAAGIHLIIATQRPSVDVITGVIKANIPSRIAFSVSSTTDSRTILDSGGAEKLLGKGDMLFFPIGASKPTRIQGAFLTDDEVEKVVDYVISQQKAQYQENMIPTDEPESNVHEIDDDLYDEAVQLVTQMQTASVSMLQRRFRIGYTRAARLIDAMEAREIVGPYEGSKPRTVLVNKQPDDDALTQ
ncbi:DNA translocase FtsK [Terrilactibacillus laevilacticus]|uniref:DNA translocase FtsK n=1 Tax=Terrilactibacillus laevilacticus TaxID=1380157 RepID=A0ABW5PPT4_9BACI|nr:DNA translocase FtsK [Terrilactibacillus laevilacticus]